MLDFGLAIVFVLVAVSVMLVCIFANTVLHSDVFKDEAKHDAQHELSLEEVLVFK